MKADQIVQFLRFVVVGGVGFIVDGGLLLILLAYGVDTYLARVFSFPMAVISTWWLNRIWTFSSARQASPGRQLNFYLAVRKAIGAKDLKSGKFLFDKFLARVRILGEQR